LDISPQEKTSNLFHCIAGTLGRELVPHRKAAIAKAFLARQGSTSPTANNGLGKGDNISVAAERLFRWEDLDQRLISPKTSELAKEMHSRGTEADRKIAFETARSLNSAGYLPRLFDFHEQLTDEWAQRLYAAHCDAWAEQNRLVSPAFIRAIRDRPIAQLFAARKSSVKYQVSSRSMRTGESINQVALLSWDLRMDRLVTRWRNRLEAEAVACEYHAARNGQIDTPHRGEDLPQPRGMQERHTSVSKPHPLPHSGKQTPKKPGRRPRLAQDFVDFAGNLWSGATTIHSGGKVSTEQLRQIASELDAKGYNLPPSTWKAITQRN